jgi:hypothetical protein
VKVLEQNVIPHQIGNLTNQRIVKSREETIESGVLVCNDPENQFN